MKLFILQTVITDYRGKFYLKIREKLGDNFEYASGNNYFEKSIATDWSINGIFPIKNYYFLNRKILVQTGMYKKVIAADVLVLELNPRILTNWIILIIRKIISKKTVLWGHAWPRNGENSLSDIVRGWMRKLGDIVVTYTEKQSIELRKKMPFKDILFAPNALYYKEDMNVLNKFDPLDIIYVGRLTKSKKPLILLEAFIKSIKSIPEKSRLVIVGNGPEKEKLLSLVVKNKLEKRVLLMGHISDINMLQDLYSAALFSVSPGYVGLSITQSFGFGVPMLISKDEPHAPEIEAAILGKNSLFFETDSIYDLSEKIISFYKKSEFWIENRTVISKFCKDKYSVERMAKVFINLI